MSTILEFTIDGEEFQLGQVLSGLFDMVSQQGESSETDVLDGGVSKSCRPFATLTGIRKEKPSRRRQRNGTGLIIEVSSFRR